MGERLAGKVALVTGGGGGIGEATARLYWEEGAKVMIVDLDGDAAQTAADGIDPSGDRIGAIAADLTKESEAERAVRETVARFGRLDVLANIAAVRVHGPVTEATAESWDFVVGVNLLAVAYGCKFAIPEMVKQRRRQHHHRLVGERDRRPHGHGPVRRHQERRPGAHPLDGLRPRGQGHPGQRRLARPDPDQYHIRNRVKRTGETARGSRGGDAGRRARRTRCSGARPNRARSPTPCSSWPATSPPTSPAPTSRSTAASRPARLARVWARTLRERSRSRVPIETMVRDAGAERPCAQP